MRSFRCHTPVQEAAVMLHTLQYTRRQNAHFTETIFFFSEEDPDKAALFLFSLKKIKHSRKSENRRCTLGQIPAAHMETSKIETG